MIVQELFAKLGLEVDEGAFQVAEKAIEGLKHGFVAVGAATAAAVAAIAGTVNATARHAAELGRTSERLGISAEKFQLLAGAADEFGISGQDLEHSLVLMARAASGAEDGTGGLSDAMKKFGIPLRDANGQLRSSDVLFEDFADKFAAMPGGIEKTNFALQAFGRSGAALIPFLNKGRAGIREMGEEARALGIVLDDSTIRAGKEYAAATNNFRDALEGVTYAIGGPLIGEFTEVIKQMTKWIAENRKFIAQKVHRFWGFISKAAETLWKVLKVLVSVIQTVNKHVDLLQVGLVALGAIILQSLVGAMVALGGASIAAAASAVAAWAAALLPFVALYLILEDLYYFFTGGDSLTGRMVQSLEGFGAYLERHWKDWTKNFFIAGYQIWDDTIEGWKIAFGRFFDWVWDSVKSMASKISDAVVSASKTALGALPGGAFLVEHVFGGGATSPQAAVQNSASLGAQTVVSAPQIRADVQIQAAPGMSTDDLADSFNRKIQEIFDTHLQENYVAVGQ